MAQLSRTLYRGACIVTYSSKSKGYVCRISRPAVMLAIIDWDGFCDKYNPRLSKQAIQGLRRCGFLSKKLLRLAAKVEGICVHLQDPSKKHPQDTRPITAIYLHNPTKEKVLKAVQSLNDVFGGIKGMSK